VKGTPSALAIGRTLLSVAPRASPSDEQLIKIAQSSNTRTRRLRSYGGCEVVAVGIGNSGKVYGAFRRQRLGGHSLPSVRKKTTNSLPLQGNNKTCPVRIPRFHTRYTRTYQPGVFQDYDLAPFHHQRHRIINAFLAFSMWVLAVLSGMIEVPGFQTGLRDQATSGIALDSHFR
jgi:hypothetical protein